MLKLDKNPFWESLLTTQQAQQNENGIVLLAAQMIWGYHHFWKHLISFTWRTRCLPPYLVSKEVSKKNIEESDFIEEQQKHWNLYHVVQIPPAGVYPHTSWLVNQLGLIQLVSWWIHEFLWKFLEFINGDDHGNYEWNRCLIYEL